MPPESRKEHVPQARRAYIRQKDLDAHGYTKNCAKCQSIILYGPQASSTPHTDECRARIEAEWAKTEEGRARLQQAENRTDRFIELKIREGEATAAAQRGAG